MIYLKGEKFRGIKFRGFRGFLRNLRNVSRKFFRPAKITSRDFFRIFPTAKITSREIFDFYQPRNVLYLVEFEYSALSNNQIFWKTCNQIPTKNLYFLFFHSFQLLVSTPPPTPNTQNSKNFSTPPCFWVSLPLSLSTPPPPSKSYGQGRVFLYFRD